MNKDTKAGLQKENAGESQGERGGYGNTTEKARASDAVDKQAPDDEGTPKVGMSKINESGKGSGNR